MEKKEWDVKQLGAGGGIVALVALFFSQGMEQMNKTSDVQQQAAIERSLANSERINRLENRIDRGFDEIKEQVSKVSDYVRSGYTDRFTKTDHTEYARAVEVRFERIEDKIIILKTELATLKNK